MIVGKIEKDIPLGPGNIPRKLFCQQLDLMEIGDSILIQAEDGESLPVLHETMRRSVYRYGIEKGKRFSLRFNKKNYTDFRIWRIK